MNLKGLFRLSGGELVAEIATHLPLLSRPSPLRVLGSTSLPRRYESTTLIWNLIFKDDRWIRRVLQCQKTQENGPVLCLLGSDLKKLYHYGKSKGINLSLLVNDWTGDVRYYKDLFFESLRDYEYDKENSVVRLKDSGIFLHIGDAIGSLDWIPTVDLGKLFHRRGHELSTNAIYYTEDVLHEIGHSYIGGIEGFPVKKKRAVRDICSIRLKFSDGSPVYRVLINPSKTVRVVNIRVREENGTDWVARWRVAGPHEREWRG